MTTTERFRYKFAEGIGGTVVDLIGQRAWDLPVELHVLGSDGTKYAVEFKSREQLFSPVFDPQEFSWPIRLLFSCPSRHAFYTVQLSR